MKFETKKENIYEKLSLADKMTGKNSSLPVLEAVLLSLEGNNLIIRATNLDLAIEETVSVKGAQNGVVAVLSKTILSYLNNIKDDEKLTFELVDNTLKIQSTFSEVLIKTMVSDDFPVIPRIETEAEFSISAKDIVTGIKSVVYASSVSSMKPELSSVYIYKNDNNEMVFVATDSFRLAEKKISAKGVGEEIKTLIPFKNTLEIIRVFEDFEGEVKVSLNKNQLSISADNIYMVSRVVDGVFPDYNQIVPKKFTTEVIALKQDVINALKIINVFSDKFNQVNILLDAEKKEFLITTKNNDVGETFNAIPTTFTGEGVQMNFNYRYIVDSFQSISVDSISFNFNGVGKPLVIKGISDPSFMYLVMPMNK